MIPYDDGKKVVNKDDDPLTQEDLMDAMWQSMTEQKEDSERLSSNMIGKKDPRHSEPIAQEDRKFSRLCADLNNNGRNSLPRTEGLHHNQEDQQYKLEFDYRAHNITSLLDEETKGQPNTKSSNSDQENKSQKNKVGSRFKFVDKLISKMKGETTQQKNNKDNNVNRKLIEEARMISQTGITQEETNDESKSKYLIVEDYQDKAVNKSQSRSQAVPKKKLSGSRIEADIQYQKLHGINQEKVTGVNQNNSLEEVPRKNAVHDLDQLQFYPRRQSSFEEQIVPKEEKFCNKTHDKIEIPRDQAKNSEKNTISSASNSMDSQEAPIKLESFLNMQEFQAIEKLNHTIHKSGSRKMSILDSISNISKTSSQLQKKMKIEQQGTAISITGVHDQQDLDYITQLLIKNRNLKITRIIPYLENDEVLLNMQTFNDTDEVMKFLRSKNFKTNSSSESQQNTSHMFSSANISGSNLATLDNSTQQKSSQDIFLVPILDGDCSEDTHRTHSLPRNYVQNPAQVEEMIQVSDDHMMYIKSNEANFQKQNPMTASRVEDASYQNQLRNMLTLNDINNQKIPCYSAGNQASFLQESSDSTEKFSYIPPLTYSQHQPQVFVQQNQQIYFINHQQLQHLGYPLDSVNNSIAAGSITSQQINPLLQKKRDLIGPKNNQVNFERLLLAEQNNDLEILRQTTLMIKNIPIKFNQAEMMTIIDEKFKDIYDYFYLPKDLKTQQCVGFAFINMVHPLYILDFYLEFNGIKWSDKISKCKSNKYCQITYANVQGIEEIKAELMDKNIMKKNEDSIRPKFFEHNKPDQQKIKDIQLKYLNDPNYISLYKKKLVEFEQIQVLVEQQRQQADQEKKLREQANAAGGGKKASKKNKNAQQQQQAPSEFTQSQYGSNAGVPNTYSSDIFTQSAHQQIQVQKNSQGTQNQMQSTMPTQLQWQNLDGRQQQFLQGNQQRFQQQQNAQQHKQMVQNSTRRVFYQTQKEQFGTGFQFNPSSQIQYVRKPNQNQGFNRPPNGPNQAVPLTNQDLKNINYQYKQSQQQLIYSNRKVAQETGCDPFTYVNQNKHLPNGYIPKYVQKLSDYPVTKVYPAGKANGPSSAKETGWAKEQRKICPQTVQRIQKASLNNANQGVGMKYGADSQRRDLSSSRVAFNTGNQFKAMWRQRK